MVLAKPLFDLGADPLCLDLLLLLQLAGLAPQLKLPGGRILSLPGPLRDLRPEVGKLDIQSAAGPQFGRRHGTREPLLALGLETLSELLANLGAEGLGNGDLVTAAGAFDVGIGHAGVRPICRSWLLRIIVPLHAAKPLIRLFRYPRPPAAAI